MDYITMTYTNDMNLNKKTELLTFVQGVNCQINIMNKNTKINKGIAASVGESAITNTR